MASDVVFGLRVVVFGLLFVEPVQIIMLVSTGSGRGILWCIRLGVDPSRCQVTKTSRVNWRTAWRMADCVGTSVPA